LLSSRFEDFHQKTILAQKVRRMFVEQFCEAFEKANIDFFVGPTTIGEEPPKIKDITENKEKANPVHEYKMDYYTIFPNAAGSPCITLPF
jgi:Asp-tRNA(Asn)/Glu-tRNA(Gln) amidotransferase A subunit family amidase